MPRDVGEWLAAEESERLAAERTPTCHAGQCREVLDDRLIGRFLEHDDVRPRGIDYASNHLDACATAALDVVGEKTKGHASSGLRQSTRYG